MACLTSCEDVGAAGAVTSPVGSSEVKRISERGDRGGHMEHYRSYRPHDRQDTWTTTGVTHDMTDRTTWSTTGVTHDMRDRTTASPDLAVQGRLWGSGQDWESYQ